jgi:hypothetical protein
VGTSEIVTKYRPGYRLAALLTLVSLLGIGALQRTGPEVANRLACDRSAPAESQACWPEPERDLLTLAKWVRDSTPSEAIFFVSKERGFYVHAGRKSINQDRALDEDSASVGAYLRAHGVTYTVLSPIGVLASKHGRVVSASCREFELVKQFTPRTLLLRVLPGRSPSDSTAACAATREYMESAGNPS